MFKTVCWLLFCWFCFETALLQSVWGQSEKTVSPVTKDSTAFKNQIGFALKLNSYEPSYSLYEISYKRKLNKSLYLRLGLGADFYEDSGTGNTPNNNYPMTKSTSGKSIINATWGIEKQFSLFSSRLTISLGCDLRYLRCIRQGQTSYRDSLDNGMTSSNYLKEQGMIITTFAELQYKLSKRFSLCVQTSANVGVSLTNTIDKSYSINQEQYRYSLPTTTDTKSWHSFITPVRNFSLFYHF